MVDQGLLVIESAMLEARSLKHLELLYCPVERSPYEPTCCAFFNQLGLEVTLRSMNVHVDQKHVCPTDKSRFRGLSDLERTVRRLIRQKVDVPRQLFVCRNDPDLEKNGISSSGKTTLPKAQLPCGTRRMCCDGGNRQKLTVISINQVASRREKDTGGLSPVSLFS